MSDGVHHRLPDRLQRIVPALLTPSASVDPGLDGRIPANEVECLFNDTGLDGLSRFGERSRGPRIGIPIPLLRRWKKRYHRATNAPSFLCVIVLGVSRIGDGSDARLRQVLLAARAEQEKPPGAGNCTAPIFSHDPGIHQETNPTFLIGLVGIILSPNVAEVVDQAPLIEI